jgi:DNA-binding NtrC family response regulator
MAVKRKILIADDDTSGHPKWLEMLASWGYEAVAAADGEEALELITTFQPTLLLCDLSMPRKSGLEVIEEIKRRNLDLATVMISGVGQVPDAVRAIKLGAYDYLTKPVDFERLRILLNNLNVSHELSRENERLRRHLIQAGKLGPLIGDSPTMRRVMALVEQLAPSSASAVLLGESGTGKEVVAHTIHDLSPRKERPFVAINCAALPAQRS